MRRQIGLFDAKTNLSKLAEQVRRTGESVTLTKHGQPWVDVVPHRGFKSVKRSKKVVLNDLAALRKELPKVDMTDIFDSIREGRR